MTPVLDYALDRNEVDKQRIGLMGISMGGYLAARAASFEHRIAACILYNGVYDGRQALESALPPMLREAYEKGEEKLVNAIIEILMDSDSNLKFNMKHGMWTTGSKTPLELIQKSTSFTLDGIANKIRCPTLVLEAQKDDSFPGQPQKVFNALTCTKTHILFTEEEGAEEHCQCTAPVLSNQRIFDWLDEIMQNLEGESSDKPNIVDTQLQRETS